MNEGRSEVPFASPTWLTCMFAVALPVVGAALIWLDHHFDLWAVPPEASPNQFLFGDGFESAESLDDLCPRDASCWHGSQQQPTASTVES